MQRARRGRSYYEIDDNESKHALSLDEYGQEEAKDSWVLLEPPGGVRVMPRGEGAVRARASLTDCTVNMNMTGYCTCADESTRHGCVRQPGLA